MFKTVDWQGKSKLAIILMKFAASGCFACRFKNYAPVADGAAFPLSSDRLT
jgi:hypothetical protein